MPPSNWGSAIDDDFASLAQSRAAPDDAISQPPWAARGPQDGSWSVDSRSDVSGIDDRCPTVWGSVHGHLSGRGRVEEGTSKPLSRDLIEKFRKAVVTERESARGEGEVVKASARSIRSERSNVEDTRPKLQEPKAFYVPKIRTARAVDRQSDLRTPTPVTRKKQTEPRPRSPSPQPAQLVASVVKSTKMIRIKGKDGREAFIQIPAVLPRAVSHTSASRDCEVEVAAEETAKRPQQVSKKQHKKLNRQQQQGQKLQQKNEVNDARAATSKIAAAALMSGARVGSPAKIASPPAWKAPSVRSVAQDSGVAFADVFEAKSVSARSLRSAVQAISANSRVSSFARTMSEAKVPSATAQRREYTPAFHQSRVTGKDRDETKIRSAKASVHSEHSAHSVSVQSLRSAVQAINANSRTPGWNDEPDHPRSNPPSTTYEHASKHSYAASRTPSHSFANFPAHHSNSPSTTHERTSNPSSRTPSHSFANFPAYHYTPSPADYALPPSHTSSTPRRPPSTPHRIPTPRPTVFAGKGWISPHPLSLAPSWVWRVSPPQSRIALPAEHTLEGEGEGEMTYGEWQAVQEEVKEDARIWERVGSEISSGRRVGSVRNSRV